jgi:ABC-type branched-subunit amino acid transport system ATPase component/branched-subunit amino acid ABC-type transport system permease component
VTATELLLYALLGLGTGSLYAGLAMGLVVIYRGSGVVNFGHAALGMWSAFVTDELRGTGTLVLPIVGLPGEVSLGGPMGALPAIAIGVASSAALAVIAYLLVFRRLSGAPVIARVLASIGLLLALQALIVLQFGTEPRSVGDLFSSAPVELLGVSVPGNRLMLAAVVVTLALGLACYFRFTLPGLVTRASVESEAWVALSGFSPQRIAVFNWGLGAAVTALIVTLASPVSGLNPALLGLLVVPGLAGLLVGGLTSVMLAGAAGLALGVVNSELGYLQLQPWWPEWATAGVVDVMPFLVIVVVLFAIGKRLPTRGSLLRDPLPEVFRGPIRPGVALGGVAAGILALVVTGGAYRLGVINSMIFSIVALSLVVLTGYVGQISLAQAAIAGIAGFALIRFDSGLPFPVDALAAALVAAGIGVLIGLPALRIRGAQLAVVTLAAAVAIESLVLRNPSINDPLESYIEAPRVAGVDLAIQQGYDIARLPFGLFVLAVLAVACLGVHALGRGPVGQRFLAVRSNERAATAVGINVSRTKLTAFAISAFLAGVAGTLMGYSRGQISAEQFGLFVGIGFLVYANLGGITSVTGALIAGLYVPLGVIYVIGERLLELGDWYALISGVIVMGVVVAYPEGAAAVVLRRRRPARDQPEAAPRSARPNTFQPVPDERLLEVKGLSVRYGGVQAVRDVSFTLPSGRVIGLIGPNGAGKTSLIDALTGFTPAGGEVSLGGEDLTGLGPVARQRAGLSRTWQSIELFDDLTVAENVSVATPKPPAGSHWLRWGSDRAAQAREDGRWALELMNISDAAPLRVGELTTGSQKLVGLARALAGEPRILLADEPAAGLDAHEVVLLGRRLRSIAAKGVTILLVEHRLELVLEICDEVLVLVDGALLTRGLPHVVRQDPRVIDAYVGADVPEGSSPAHRIPTAPAEKANR